MKTHAVSGLYEALLQSATGSVKTCSSAHWNTDYQHDPGLTTLQILVNRLGLIQEQYEALVRKPDLFARTKKHPSWQPSPGRPDALRFYPDLSGPVPLDFETLAATSRDICAAIRKIPGIRHAWIKKPEAGTPPELLVEMAPVLPERMEKHHFVYDDARFRVFREKDAFRQIEGFLTTVRGICQPVLSARPCRVQALHVELHIGAENDDFSRSAQKEMLVQFLSDLIRDLEGYLRGEKEPVSSVSATSVGEFLKSSSACPCFSLTGLRLGSAAGETLGFVQGHDTIVLEPDADVLGIGDLTVLLFCNGVSRTLSLSTVEDAFFDAHQHILAHLWQHQWTDVRTQKADQDFCGHPCAMATDDPFPSVSEQFPACYRLFASDAMGMEKADQAKILQFQGWLLLFDVLFRELQIPLAQPEQLFSPKNTHLLEDGPEFWHPLLEKLTENFGAGYLATIQRSTGVVKAQSALLQYLGALQGETPWFVPAHFETLATKSRLALLSVWVRKLPWLNSRRLVSSGVPGGGWLRDIRTTPLEERLSLLLLPFACERGLKPVVEQSFFDMRVSRNPVTQKDEYRVYIRDEKQPDGKESDDRKNLRMVCRLVSRTPEEAEAVACLALRLAELPEHYQVSENGIRIAWIADLVLSAKETEKEDATVRLSEPGRRTYAERIAENVAWVKGILPPWIKVLEYQALGDDRPFEIAILVEEESVPVKWRPALLERIMDHVPAHIFPRVFFIGREERHKMDALLYKPVHPDHGERDRRDAELLSFLHSLEEGAV